MCHNPGDATGVINLGILQKHVKSLRYAQNAARATPQQTANRKNCDAPTVTVNTTL